MTSPAYPAWQPAHNNSTNNPHANFEYCDCPQAYSYYEDTEPEGDDDMNLDAEYQALLAHASDVEAE
eukprot:4653153-Prorocentrum_lima.AAC.1